MPSGNGHYRHRIDPVAIGNRVRRRRLALDLSQRQLSVDGISYAYISRIEHGTRTPSLYALIALAEQLDTTAHYLATGRHTPSREGCPFCGR